MAETLTSPKLKTGNLAASKLRRLARQMLRNETAQAAILLTLALLVFLSTPLLNSRDHYYSAADLTQMFSLPKIDPAHEPGNGLLGDTIDSFQPWLMLSREALHAGKMPLWNPYNAGGVPLLANYQSAVFSVYSLPFYLFTFRQALLISAFLKLFGIGFFTFLFLKELKLRQGPALLGAVAFMFSGYNVLWLFWPMASVAVVLPASLYFAERIFSRIEQAFKTSPQSLPQLKYTGSLIGLSLSLLTGLLGGHPETLFSCLVLIAAYILFRLLNLWQRQGYGWLALRRVAVVAIQLIGAALVALGLAAIQVLPFLEYLVNSSALAQRTTVTESVPQVLGFGLWSLMLFPEVLGNNTLPFNLYDRIPTAGNFSEANSGYIGGLVLLLAALSLAYAWRDKYIRFFAAAWLVWVVYAYNLFGLGSYLRVIPGLSIIPITRTHLVWLFCLSGCAAFFVNHLLQNRGQPRRAVTFLAIIIGGSGLALALQGVRALAKEYYNYIIPDLAVYLDYVPGYLYWAGGTFGLGLLLIALLGLHRAKWLGSGLVALLTGLIFWQSGYLLKDYNPITKDPYFFPVSPAIERIQQTVGSQNVVITGGDTLIPNTNVPYRLFMLTNIDAVWIYRYDRLYQELFGGETGFRTTTKVSEAALKLFGVDYIVSSTTPSNVHTATVAASQNYALGELLPGKVISQSFKAESNGLQSVKLVLATYNRTNSCTLNLRLEELPAATVVAQSSISCRELKDNSDYFFTFPALANSDGKQYRVLLESPDGKPGNAVTAWAWLKLDYADGKLEKSGQSLPGGLLFDLGYGNSTKYEAITKLKRNFNLYRVKYSPSRYYSVGQARIAASDEAAFRQVLAPDFEPNREVVLTKLAQPAQTSSETEPVKLISEEDTRVRLSLSRREPGYVVLNKSYYPGWKARVNGQERPVLAANYAFSAIEVGSGESQIEFFYDPDSFRYGWLISLLSGLVGLGLVTGGWWWRVRRSKAQTGQDRARNEH